MKNKKIKVLIALSSCMISLTTYEVVKGITIIPSPVSLPLAILFLWLMLKETEK